MVTAGKYDLKAVATPAAKQMSGEGNHGGEFSLNRKKVLSSTPLKVQMVTHTRHLKGRVWQRLLALKTHQGPRADLII